MIYFVLPTVFHIFPTFVSFCPNLLTFCPTQVISCPRSTFIRSDTISAIWMHLCTAMCTGQNRCVLSHFHKISGASIGLSDSTRTPQSLVQVRRLNGNFCSQQPRAGRRYSFFNSAFSSCDRQILKTLHPQQAASSCQPVINRAEDVKHNFKIFYA